MSEATRVRIALGSLEFDGYMIDGQADEDGLPIFGFNLTQAAMMLGLTEDASQAVKRSIQESKTKFAQTHFPQGFGSIPKVKGETDSGVIRALTILPIQGFERLALCAAVSGKTQAIQIQAALAGYSLRKIFSRSFGVKFTDEDAENWIAARFVGIEKRNLWTDAIKEWTLTPGLSENAKKWVYSNVSDRLNLALTGHKGRYWCDKLGCDSSTLRNYWNDRHLDTIADIEKHATKVLAKTGCTPLEAMEAAIEFMDEPVNPTPLKVAEKEEKEPYDKVSYMRQYMREKRAKAKASIE